MTYIDVDQKKKFMSMTLDEKTQRTKELIFEWFLQYKGQVYVSFSGGKDSTVLLHIARSIGRGCENIKGVFIDTGLEFPEIRDFVKKQENIDWIKPKMTFKQVIEKYGWPIISKEQSQYIYEVNTTKSQKLKSKRLGTSGFNVAEKWRPLIGEHVSNKCCDVMKKGPAKKFEKETGLKPIVATMASESRLRYTEYMKGNCNAFNSKRPISRPMSFWTEQDVLEYIKRENIEIASVYGTIIKENGLLKTTGRDRTGCVFCMYGLHLDNSKRFCLLQKTHPKLYDYVMNTMSGKDIYDKYMKCAGVK